MFLNNTAFVSVNMTAHIYCNRQPFESAEKAVNENLDILSQKNILETENHRILVEETDEGEILREKVHDLKQLVRAYQLGWIKETRCDDSVW